MEAFEVNNKVVTVQWSDTCQHRAACVVAFPHLELSPGFLEV